MKLFLAKISERATKSMMSGGNSALLPANVDRRPTLEQSLTNSQLQIKISSYITNHVKTGPSGKQLILFLSNLKVFLGSA